MSKEATLSTVIDAEVKDAVTQYCRERGFKLRYVIEQALIEQLEDAIDLEAYRARRHEATIPLSKVLSARNKKKK